MKKVKENSQGGTEKPAGSLRNLAWNTTLISAGASGVQERPKVEAASAQESESKPHKIKASVWMW